MIGRLVLSSRNLYKVQSKGKLVNARKCYILSSNTDDILVQTTKEFNPKDIYVKLSLNEESDIIQINQILGTVGNQEDDLNIFHHIYTKDWMSNSKYKKLWDEYKINPLIGSANRHEYTNQVITIDPLGAVDLDDGFTFSSDESNYYLDIHIADPISFFDFSNPIMIEIFKEFINRISTCYIPDSKGSNHAIHLLPEHIVKHVSLLETTEEIPKRRAVSFLFTIDKQTNAISYQLQYTYLSNIVNKTYEQFDLEINNSSQTDKKQELVNLVNSLITNMDLRYKPIDITEDISHKMIEIFMILVNDYVSVYLEENSDFMIVRGQDKKDLPDDFEKIPEYCLNFLNYSANYQIINSNEFVDHYALNLTNYCHMSSPMRRVIDMLNHMLMRGNSIYGLDVEKFIKENVDINLINEKIRSHKKISNAYELIKILNINKNFRACALEIIKKDDVTYGLLVLRTKITVNDQEIDFKKMINVEIPKTHENIERYQEFDVELHYNSVNFKTSKFPFYIRII